MKVSLCFYPNEQKKGQKNDVVPIYVRVRFNGKKAEGRLYHADLKEQEMRLWGERTMRLIDSKHMANKLINGVQKEFDEFIIMNSKSLMKYSANSIRDLLLNRNLASAPTVIGYIEKYFTSSIERSANLSIGTKKNYIKANRHLKMFLTQTRKQSLSVNELTPTIAIEFKDYLLCSTNGSERKGMTEQSALGNIKKFRTIFDRAIDEGMLDRNPFKLIKLKNRSPKKPKLTINQVKDLIKIDLTKYPRLVAYKDLFLFSCFTGIAYEDGHNLV
jgi:hypothetical protein